MRPPKRHASVDPQTATTGHWPPADTNQRQPSSLTDPVSVLSTCARPWPNRPSETEPDSNALPCSSRPPLLTRALSYAPISVFCARSLQVSQDHAAPFSTWWSSCQVRAGVPACGLLTFDACCCSPVSTSSLGKPGSLMADNTRHPISRGEQAAVASSQQQS